MILKVFTRIGTTLSIANAYTALISLYSNQSYPSQKAAGSLGGAVTRGRIRLENGFYTRIR